MDRTTLEQHLAQAEMHISQGEHHVARQGEIVAELAYDGRDLNTAQALLVQFETMMAHHIADRDRIRTELTRTVGVSSGVSYSREHLWTLGGARGGNRTPTPCGTRF